MDYSHDVWMKSITSVGRRRGEVMLLVVRQMIHRRYRCLTRVWSELQVIAARGGQISWQHWVYIIRLWIKSIFMLATYNNVKWNFATPIMQTLLPPNIQQPLRRHSIFDQSINQTNFIAWSIPNWRDFLHIYFTIFFHISKLTTIQKSIDSSPFSLHLKLLSACQAWILIIHIHRCWS